MSCVTFCWFLFPTAQERTELCLWDQLHSLAGTWALPQATFTVPPGKEGLPSAWSVDIRKSFQKAFCTSVPTLGFTWKVHDPQLGCCNTTKSTFWQQLLMWPKPGAVFPHGGVRAELRDGLSCLLPLSTPVCLPPPSKSCCGDMQQLCGGYRGPQTGRREVAHQIEGTFNFAIRSFSVWN